jgi:hypothetical protein
MDSYIFSPIATITEMAVRPSLSKAEERGDSASISENGNMPVTTNDITT